MSVHLTSRFGRRSGFSLVEMLMAVALLGLLLAIAAPRIADAGARRNVKGARAAIASTYARARIHALQARVPVTVQFDDSLAWVITPNGAGADTVGAVQNLGQLYGVSVVATGSIPISATGLVANTPISVTVTKGAKSETFTVTGYGRIQ